MERELVSEEELLKWMNYELSKHEKCNGCRFISVVRLRGKDKHGCNWSSVNVHCSGTPSEVCFPVTSRVASQAKERFNLLAR